MNPIEPEVISNSVRFTVWEWTFFAILGLILLGVVTLLFNVFGFVIGLGICIFAIEWLREKG